MAEAGPTAAIATTWFVSEGAVEKHVATNIFSKLVPSRPPRRTTGGSSLSSAYPGRLMSTSTNLGLNPRRKRPAKPATHSTRQKPE